MTGSTRRRRRPQVSTGIKGMPVSTIARLDSSKREQARRHGLTLDELVAMGDACMICGFTGPLAVDHDHAAAERDGHDPAVGCRRCVRGVLCDYCNTGLGKFQDEPDKLRAGADYLERFMLRRSQADGRGDDE